MTNLTLQNESQLSIFLKYLLRLEDSIAELAYVLKITVSSVSVTVYIPAKYSR